MANDEIFIVNLDWQAVQLEGDDIKDGTFSLFNRGNNTIEVRSSDVLPTDNSGSATMSKRGDNVKFSLTGDKKLFVRTPNTRAEIGVISG